MRQTNRKPFACAVFRRWAGKKYAVFNSLKRVIKIAPLAVVYLTFANHGVAQVKDAHDGITRQYSLEAVDVTGEQQPETYSSVARVVVTITKSEIERAAVSSLNELLEYASNIDIRQRGTNGMQADISIRGGSFDQVLILLNGVNITDPQTGHHNLNIPVDLSIIERIEILKGPGAWRFGPGAFSGAINVVTTSNSKSFVKAALEVGQFSLHEEKISAVLKHSKFSHLMSANRAQSNGYTDNTDYRLSNLYYQGSYTVQACSVNFQLGYTDKGFGANSFYSAKYPNQFEEIQTLFGSLGFKTTHNNIIIEPKIYYRRNIDRFLLFRDNPSLYSNYHTSDVWGTNILANILHGATASTTIGADVRTETIWSNNLGYIIENPVVSQVNDTVLLNRFHSRSNLSLFAGHKHYIGKLMVNAGINLTRNTDQSFKWFLYPGVDLSYSISNKSTISGTMNKSMRMPTFTDLYYNGPQNQGNSGLLPEESIGYELRYEFKQKGFQSSVAAFHSNGKNLIDWVKENPKDVWRTINYTKLNTSGLELQGKTDLRVIFPQQKRMNTISAGYTYITQNKPDTQLISNYGLNYLKHRVDVDFNHSLWRFISINWHLAYQDRHGKYEKVVDKISLGMNDYEPFMNLDIKLSCNIRGWNAFLSVNNLLNANYYDYGNVPQPGRWVKAGIAKKIDFN